MKYFVRIISLFLVCCLLATATLAEAADSENAMRTDGGLIRVKLDSLGTPDGLYLTLEGGYVARGSSEMYIQPGTEIAVAADKDDIYMYAGGLWVNMGAELEFSGGADGGMYIYESEKDALYMGDLTLTCDGGALSAVLTLSVEDYLCGVVAYEMSNSFPLEALKAQAVAARTYAVSKRAARAGKSYDVSDTTADQVFKGYIGAYENVIRAVRETDGVVGMYGDDYAECFYTASNGGQVATPNQVWGGDGDYGYIEMKEDPYDLENPLSLVNDFSMPAQYDADNALWQLLEQRLEMPEARIDRINDIVLTEPDAEGSLMYGAAEFQLDISVEVQPECIVDGECIHAEDMFHMCTPAEWESVEGGATVVLDVYDDIKDGLDLGLNGRDYEICTVRNEDDVYYIEMRRYGHGAGMSQRGAQTMAEAHGFGYEAILAFYYPGMQLVKTEWEIPETETVPEMPQALKSEVRLIPPAEDWPEGLREGEYFAVVVLDDRRARLNVRSIPSTEGRIIAKLDNGYRLAVMDMTDDGWAHVRAAEFEGYVKAEYITAE